MSNESNQVKAIYSFKGTNNDELCFKKGDIITVTQREEGGWWEGTLGETTGWFPSNYVVDYKEPSGSVTTSPVRAPSEIQAFRNVVLKDIIDSEKAHVTELQGLVTNFLQPLEKSDILTRDEYKQLTGNILEVLQQHELLLAKVEECEGKTGPDQRVGGLFLQWAPRIQAVHETYCAGHPRAVCILDKYKEELNALMEACGAVSPGLLVLTAALSKPFRRVGKYAAMLQELGRHVHEAHPDRGDTHRAVAVYRDIATKCASVRRQKELELQVVTGSVRGWQGGDLSSTLGDVLHMGGVAVGERHDDRYLVLFPASLLMLSVSKRMSAYVYEGCLPLTGITVCKLEDTDARKNAFEISGPMIDTIIAVCQTKAEADNWVALLQKHSNPGGHVSDPSQPQSLPYNLPTSDSSLSIQSQSATNHKRSHSFNNHLSYTDHLQQMQQIQQQKQQRNNPPSTWLGNSCNAVSSPSSRRQNSSSIASKFTSIDFMKTPNINSSNRGWRTTSLRPAPPLKPQLLGGASSEDSAGPHPYAPNQRKANSYEEDALILRVIEAYCTSARCRNTVSSVEPGRLSRGNVQTHAHATNNASPSYRNTFALSRNDLDARYLGGVKIKRYNSSLTGDALRTYRVPEARKLLSERKFKLNRSNPSLAEKLDWGGENGLGVPSSRRGGSSSPPRIDPQPPPPRAARSTTWCCGSFVKQLRKSHHFD